MTELFNEKEHQDRIKAFIEKFKEIQTQFDIEIIDFRMDFDMNMMKMFIHDIPTDTLQGLTSSIIAVDDTLKKEIAEAKKQFERKVWKKIIGTAEHLQ